MMKEILTLALVGALSCGPALAGRRSIKVDSASGQAPQVLTAAPGPGMRIGEFQVFLVDDHSCPDGQIKRWTAGSKRKQIRHTEECVAR